VNKIDLKTSEFSEIYKFSNRTKSIVKTLLDRTYEEGCMVGFDPRQLNPAHIHSGETCIIRFPKTNYSKKEIHVAFDLAHELGHHFDPITYEEQDKIEKRYISELKAWVKATKIMLLIDLTRHEELEYFSYMTYCINTYEREYLRIKTSKMVEDGGFEPPPSYS